MMTCTSDRSGIASSGVVPMAHTPAPMSPTVPSRTRNRLRIDQAMIWLIMAVLHPHRVRLRRRRLGRGGARAVRHAGHVTARGREPGFRIHQEGGRGHDGLPFLQTTQDLDPIAD